MRQRRGWSARGCKGEGPEGRPRNNRKRQQRPLAADTEPQRRKGAGVVVGKDGCKRPAVGSIPTCRISNNRIDRPPQPKGLPPCS